jgi:hypothetical protein
MTGMDTNPKRRRWYQFSLRTMFVGMILASFVFGLWVHRSREWIRQRHEALCEGKVGDFSGLDRPKAPGGLWLFGERGVGFMDVERNADYLLNCENAKRLFPEAELERTGHFPEPIRSQFMRSASGIK